MVSTAALSWQFPVPLIDTSQPKPQPPAYACRKRAERLMKAAPLVGVSHRNWTRTTIRDDHVRPASDLVDRNIRTDAPDQFWVADITYVPTRADFIYPSVVLDVRSRRIVGWSMGSDLKAQLVIDAMNMATDQMRPGNVIHHSDQGSQYTSVAFGLRCKDAGMRPSMDSVSDAHDNAICGSFFATLHCELLDRGKFRTKAAARIAIFEFIEGWHNPSRRPSVFGYNSPNTFERSAQKNSKNLLPVSCLRHRGNPNAQEGIQAG